MTGQFLGLGTQYVVMLGVFAAGGVGSVLAGRGVRGRAIEIPVRRGLAVLCAAVMVPLQAWELRPAVFSLDSLPLQLCDFAWLAAVWALWTRNWRSIAVLYFWAFSLTIQAIATPSLSSKFPSLDFFAFYVRHFTTVWTALFITAGLGQGPRWRGYRFALACTAVWAGAIIVFNALAGTNFGYLRHKPPTASVLNLFGPWPFYILVEAGLIVGVWAIVTWPWERAARRRS